MATRTVTGRVYDENGAAWASQSVVFNLLTDYATTSGETVLNKTYTLTTDNSGDFTAALAVPDSDAWQYQCSLPDGTSFIFNLAAGAATTLRAILADLNLSATVSPSDIDTLVDAHAALTTGVHGASGTILATEDVLDEDDMASDSAVYPATQQSVKAYVDAGGGGALDNLSDVTITTPADNEVLAYDGVGDWINQTAAEAGLLALAGGTMSGDIAMADNSITRPVIKDYGEFSNAAASSGATHTHDFSTDGNFLPLTLTDNCTLTLSNPSASGTLCSITIELTQDGTGSRLMTWPASFTWPGGTEPTLSTGAGDVDVITAYTRDAGTTYRGFAAGLDLS